MRSDETREALMERK